MNQGKKAKQFIKETKLNKHKLKQFNKNISLFKKEVIKYNFREENTEKILIKPRITNWISRTIQKRRSCRHFKNKVIELRKLSEILFSSCAILNYKEGKYFSTIPSAGALQTLEIYVIPLKIDNLKPRLYHYNKRLYSLELISKNEITLKILHNLIWINKTIEQAGAIFFITSITTNVFKKYQERGLNFLFQECGYVQQNISLMAESLELKSLIIGAFFEDEIKELIQAKNDEEVLGVIIIGS
jgi:SagB-type dehydrogenase family enzyme